TSCCPAIGALAPLTRTPDGNSARVKSWPCSYGYTAIATAPRRTAPKVQASAAALRLVQQAHERRPSPWSPGSLTLVDPQTLLRWTARSITRRVRRPET